MAEAVADLLLRGGTVVDGTGEPPIVADVAIRHGLVSEVGLELRGPAGSIVDVTGLVVCPGFIDVHSHDDFELIQAPEMRAKVLQGVTSVVVGNCGWGPSPGDVAKQQFGTALGYSGAASWRSHREYMDRLESEPASTNAAILAGHGALRLDVMATATHPASKVQMTALMSAVAEAMEAGAVGMSTGLIYEPGRHAEVGEIAALVRLVAEAGGVYASHIRNEGAGLLGAVGEAVDVAVATGSRLEVSHLKASGRENWGAVTRALDLLRRTGGAESQLRCDVYPYTAGSTFLRALVDNGGLVDPAAAMGQVTGDDVVIASAPGEASLEGSRLGELARRWSVDDEAAALRVLETGGAETLVIIHGMSEEDVATVLADPLTMIGSDGVPAGARPHPRLYGTFARVLGTFVRERPLLDMAAAIRKMTGLPASHFRLGRRGRIAAGSAADIVVLDADNIADIATYEEPRRHPVGIERVLVNGTQVVVDGRHTGARPGQVIRRAPE